MDITADSKKVVEQYVATVQAGDRDKIGDCFAEDAVWQLDGELPISGTWEGRDTIVADFLGTAMRYYQAGSVEITITSLIAEAENVVMEWTSQARTNSGEPYLNHCIGVFTVKDGRIARVREYMDTLYAYRAAFSAAHAA